MIPKRNFEHSAVSRRGFVAGTAGVVAASGFASPTAASGTLSVMTRNLAAGVELFDLDGASSLADVRQTAGQLFADLRRYPVAPRAEAIAAEIDATSPDVVGLQEAMLVRTRRPSNFQNNPSPSASDVVVDFLDALSAALAERGLEYEVATSQVTTDIEVPADVDEETIDVRLTDRVAVLVQADTEILGTSGDTFEAARSVSVGGLTADINRGYCTVDVSLDDADVTVADTHLEPSEASSRRGQAGELVEVLPTDRPVVLAGDFNSGPGAETDTYELLTESFRDAHTTLRPTADGYTCCQEDDLTNDESQLSRRVDAVLYRGGADPTAIERVGATADDRVSLDDESVTLWPSDHAGVVATFEIDSTVDSEETAPSDGSEQESDDRLTGFGIVGTITALLLVVLGRSSRGDGDHETDD